MTREKKNVRIFNGLSLCQIDFYDDEGAGNKINNNIFMQNRSTFLILVAVLEDYYYFIIGSFRRKIVLSFELKHVCVCVHARCNRFPIEQ